MDMQDLIIFDRLYRRLNMSDVAKELYMSQSTISYTIQKLETELGNKLFVRKGKKLESTSAGHLFAQYTVEFKSTYERLMRNFTEGMYPESIRIGFTFSALELDSTPLLSAFSRQYPKCRIFSTVDNPKALHEMLIEGRLEVLLTSEDLTAGPDTLVCVKLQESQHVLCCRKDAGYLKTEGLDYSRVTQEDLLVPELPVLLKVPPHELDRLEMQMPRPMGERTPLCRIVGMYTSFRQVKEACLAGLGVGLVPRKMIADEDGLIPFTACGLPFIDNLYLVYRRTERDRLEIRSFARLVADYYGIDTGI